MLAQRAVEQAQQQQGVVVAAGGDGTINAVAQVVLNERVPFRGAAAGHLQLL